MIAQGPSPPKSDPHLPQRTELLRVMTRRFIGWRAGMLSTATAALRGRDEPIARVGLQNLSFEILGPKRLFDETGNACVLGLNDLVYRRIGSHHDERQISVLFICTYIQK